MEAEARLQTRLENHSVLIQIAETGGRNGDGSWSVERTAWVELMKDELMEKLFSCVDICWRVASIASMGSVVSGWSS